MRLIFHLNCTECHRKGLIYDEKMGELFCQDCGMVIEDRFQMTRISIILEQLHLEEMEERRKMNEGMMKELQ